jgi:hypothetical protein
MYAKFLHQPKLQEKFEALFEIPELKMEKL